MNERGGHERGQPSLRLLNSVLLLLCSSAAATRRIRAACVALLFQLLVVLGTRKGKVSLLNQSHARDRRPLTYLSRRAPTPPQRLPPPSARQARRRAWRTSAAAGGCGGRSEVRSEVTEGFSGECAPSRALPAYCRNGCAIQSPPPRAGRNIKVLNLWPLITIAAPRACRHAAVSCRRSRRRRPPVWVRQTRRRDAAGRHRIQNFQTQDFQAAMAFLKIRIQGFQAARPQWPKATAILSSNS